MLILRPSLTHKTVRSVKVLDETAPLSSVILGWPFDFGGTPDIDDAYDPKSKMFIELGEFPSEASITEEMNQFLDVLEKHNVEVIRPTNVEGLNQVFSRDIGFTVGDKFVVSRILEKRKREIDGIHHVIDELHPEKVIHVPSPARIEGGDVMPHKGKLLVGYSNQKDFDTYVVSRTNPDGLQFLKDTFQDWEVIGFELNKSDVDPRENALHLDCCFQPVGKDLAIIYPGGFKNLEDVEFIEGLFGKEKLLYIDKEQMYNMCSNVFSISPEVVVSDRSFTRLNANLRERGIEVEEIKYTEIGKMEGLLRCSTLPLMRQYE